MNIAEIDKNFAIETEFKEEVKFYDPESEPFKIYGIFREEGSDKFVRMPQSVADTVNRGVKGLNSNTAGGRVRFITDSATIAINARVHSFHIMTHQAFVGSAGFDLFEETDEGVIYLSSYRPPADMTDGFESIARLGEKKRRRLLINFPTYAGVNKLYIGLDPDASVEPPLPYRIEKPAVYYGSSITQGGCASKPGDTYEEILSRRFGLNYVNLGFAGSACAEESIAEYISGLDMSVFIYDYDHNSPNPKHLEMTHERMLLTVREKHPDLPIIMMTRPRWVISEDTASRLEIIKRTYDNAIARGDKNIYLLTGRTLMALCKNDGSVDGVHPTSLGFFSMAEALSGVMEKILKDK